MKLIPYDAATPKEYLVNQLHIHCDSGWEMSKTMHEIDSWCRNTQDTGTIVWTSQAYTITLWFEKAKYRTWFELTR
jgi:hypothetical protein